MKITKIDIKAFRSIVNQTLILDNNCVGLVGLNESGKSNILSAVRTFDNNYTLKDNDVSKIDDELPYITFNMELDDDDISKLRTSIEELLEANTAVSFRDIFKTKKFIDNNMSRVKTINSSKAAVAFTNFNILSEINTGLLIANDIKGKENTPITLKDGVVTLNTARIVKEQDVDKEKLPAAIYAPLNKINIKNYIHAEVVKFMQTIYPEVRYWQYDSKYLIPSEVKYDEIIKDNEPREYSVPLYNIFFIAKELKLKSDNELISLIKIWQNDSSRRRKDTEIINDAVNKYVKSIWQDYNQELCIVLEETKITVHIKDPSSPRKNYYEMVERSQGFKTFISFILTISADIYSEYVQNFILVLDEPETHLHPSGVRFMRNELFKLAQKGNIVIFATHSIFMIDRQNLSRHKIITKNYECTRISPVMRNNITQESVIYEALGTTVDEFSIKPKNIMFEGVVDRQLFHFYIHNCIKKNNIVKEFELLDGGGTKAINSFFKDKLLPIYTRWVLILDNDKPARNLIDNMKQITGLDFDSQCRVIKYCDDKDIELEDILPIDMVSCAFNDAINLISGKELEVTLNNEKPVSSQVNEHKNRIGLTEEERKRAEEHFKINIEKEVEAKLYAIVSDNSTILTKLASFKQVFPKYFEFISNAIDQILKYKFD